MGSFNNVTALPGLSPKRGFTLVELMIVIAIIGIVAAVSTMSGLAARVSVNEGSALGSLKAVASASEMYRSAAGSYPENLSVLAPDYLAQDLAGGEKAGYSFELNTADQGSTFTCTAIPISHTYTGVKSYCINVLNAIQVYQNAPALSADGATCPPGGSGLSS